MVSVAGVYRPSWFTSWDGMTTVTTAVRPPASTPTPDGGSRPAEEIVPVSERPTVESRSDDTQSAADVLKELLPALRSVYLAGKHGELTGGLELIARLLWQCLGRVGLVEFDPVGEDFNPEEHHAVDVAPASPGKPAGSVAATNFPGYRLSGRLLVPAEVVVAT